MFKETRYGLIIDIGSAQIDIALISSTRGASVPTCLYTDSFEMNLTYAMSAEERIRKVRRTLRGAYKAADTCAVHALKKHGGRTACLSQTLVVFRSPWSRTATRKVYFRDVTPFTIDEKFIASLFKTLEQKLEEEYRENDIARAFDFDIIERAIVETKIDGEVVDDPIGMQGQEIVLRHYTGLAPEQINDDVRSIQDRTFPEVPVHLHSCQYVAYKVLANTYPELSSFCIITVADEATEVAIVINGTLRYATVLGIGSSTIMDQPWKDSRLGGKHLTKHIRDLARGVASKEDAEQCQKALWEYQQELRNACIEIEKHLRIPRTTMVVVSEDIRDIFVELCKETLKDVIGESSTVFVPEDVHMECIGGEKPNLPLRIAGTFFHKLDEIEEGTQ